MVDNLINPVTQVGGIKPDIQATVIQAAQAAQTVQTSQTVQANQVNQGNRSQQVNVRSQQSEKKDSTQQTKQTTESSDENLGRTPLNNLTNTALRFQVDDKTNEVTIMIVDKASDKVMRTIPPEAIKKIPPGELFEFTL